MEELRNLQWEEEAGAALLVLGGAEGRRAWGHGMGEVENQLFSAKAGKGRADAGRARRRGDVRAEL